MLHAPNIVIQQKQNRFRHAHALSDLVFKVLDKWNRKYVNLANEFQIRSYLTAHFSTFSTLFFYCLLSLSVSELNRVNGLRKCVPLNLHAVCVFLFLTCSHDEYLHAMCDIVCAVCALCKLQSRKSYKWIRMQWSPWCSYLTKITVLKISK